MTSLTLFLLPLHKTDSMLPYICLVTDQKRCTNAVRTSVTHLSNGPVPCFLFFPHFDITFDLLLNRHTET